MENFNLLDLVSIGITTKNRWEDLEDTLNKIIAVNLNYLRIIIFDDASNIECPLDISKLLFPNLTIQRFENSQGLIARRNQIAKTIKTKYYLSLDDDSYPVNNSLVDAVKFAEKQKDLFCLSFPIYNNRQNKYENSSSQKQPHKVRSFFGGGHLLHRSRFIEIGGYREELIRQGEEMEIAARAFQHDFYCYHFPNLLIHHTASNQGRNWQKIDFYGSRNNILWNDWFLPQEIKIIKQAKTLLSRILLFLKLRRFSLIRGVIVGLKEIYQYRKYRCQMDLEVFKYWQSLPHT